MFIFSVCDWCGRGTPAFDPLLTLTRYFRFDLAIQIAEIAWFNQQANKPFHRFRLSSRPQIPNNQSPKSNHSQPNNYPPYLHKCDDKSQDQIRSVSGGWFTKLHLEQFFERKWHQVAFELLCIFWLPEAFRRYSEKWLFCPQLPFNLCEKFSKCSNIFNILDCNHFFSRNPLLVCCVKLTLYQPNIMHECLMT